MSTKVLAHPIPKERKKESTITIENIKIAVIIFLLASCICLIYNNYKLTQENEDLKKTVDVFNSQVAEIPAIDNVDEINNYIFRISLSGANSGNKILRKSYESIASYLCETRGYIDDTIQNSLNQYNAIKEKYDIMVDNYKDVQKTAKAAQKQSKKILKENKALVKKLNTTEEELEKFQTRSELYNKYEYAVINNGQRTELAYSHLIKIEELCKKYGISPYLMTSEIMVESGGRQYATNSESTARGFGQILVGTGEFVYEKLLHYGNYDHSYAFNGNTNLEMMASLLGYWKNRTGSTRTAIHRYRAADYSTNEAYINKMCAVSGMTRSQLGIY